MSFDNDQYFELPKLLTCDFVAAAVSSFFIAPFITVIDRSIIENASGVRRLSEGLKQLSLDFITRPHQFIRRKEFCIVFGLYTSTYVTANCIDTLCEATNKANSTPKFLGTTAVNMTLCIAKDREFTRMFGVFAPRPLPLPSYALFAIRDCLTVAASFNFPKPLAKKFEDKGMDHSKADKAAQLLSPALIQFASTPLHLLGLDLYNNPLSSNKKRISFISKEYLKSAFARIGRIAPAFGIGGIGNKMIREGLRDRYGLGVRKKQL